MIYVMIGELYEAKVVVETDQQRFTLHLENEKVRSRINPRSGTQHIIQLLLYRPRILDP